MKDYVHKYLKENREAVLRGDSTDFTAGSADGILVSRLDAVPGKEFKKMIDNTNGWMGQYVPDDDESKSGSPIYLGLGKIADSTFDFNEGQYEKGAKSALGVEFPVGEDWWPFARDIWVNKNYGLIKDTLMKQYIGQVNDLTEKAVKSGWSVSQLTKQIQDLDHKITKSKANFIARDQIGKLNGEISQRRMEDMGLTMYIWETSGDERVRGTPKAEGGKYPDAIPSHYLMNKLLCRWDDPTVYSEDGGKTWIDRPSGAVQLHPGFDYLCRCTAVSYWEELAGEADALLDYEGPGTAEEEAERGLGYYKARGKQRAPEAARKGVEKKPALEPQKARASPKGETTKSVKQDPPAKNGQAAAQETGEKTAETAINSKLSELREWGKKTKREQASMMTQDGKVIGSAKGKADTVVLSEKMVQALDKQPQNSLVLLHNHPGSTSFSSTDFSLMCMHDSIKELRVVGSNGRTYRVSVGNGSRPSLAELIKYEKEIEAEIKREVANKMVRRQLPKGETMWSTYLSERNKAFAEKYGWEYTEGKLDG
jgi:hypothetical protein